MSEEATKTESGQATENPQANDTGVKEVASPNAEYESNPALDENGNPTLEATEEQPTKSEEKPEESPKEESAAAPEFDKTGLSQVEGLLVDAGLDMKEVAKAVTESDGQVTPEILKALEEKHGAGVASLIAAKLQGLHESNVAQAQAKDTAIFEQVHEAFNDPQGGEATWQELAGWAKENVPVSDRKEINALLAQGGIAAKLAVQELISVFKASPEFGQAADLEVADSLSQDYKGKPLDKTGYNSELRKLIAAGHSYESSPEIKALNKRRMQSRNRGI